MCSGFDILKSLSLNWETLSGECLETNNWSEFCFLYNLDLSVSEITEEILLQCGGYGLFQKKLTFLIVIFIICYGNSLLTMVFIREKIPFACYPSNFNESMIPSNITLDEFLNNLTVEGEECSVYKPDSAEGTYVLPTINSTRETCKYGRKFYTKEISSIVSEVRSLYFIVENCLLLA